MGRREATYCRQNVQRPNFLRNLRDDQIRCVLRCRTLTSYFRISVRRCMLNRFRPQPCGVTVDLDSWRPICHMAHAGFTATIRPGAIYNQWRQRVCNIEGQKAWSGTGESAGGMARKQDIAPPNFFVKFSQLFFVRKGISEIFRVVSFPNMT